MSDDQSRPRYGEYAPGYTPGRNETSGAPETEVPPPPTASAPWSAPTAAGEPGAAVAPARKRNTVDLVFTIILLGLGLIGMLAGLLLGFALTNTELLSQAFERQGYGSFQGTPGAAPAVLVVSHVVLFLAALGLSILALARRRVAFWIPLVAGVVAAVFFWGAYVTVLMSDPGFVQRMSGG